MATKNKEETPVMIDVKVTQAMIDSNPNAFKGIEVGDTIQISEDELKEDDQKEEAKLKEEEEEKLKEELKKEEEKTMPDQATIVYGGPVIKKVKMPFGFSVLNKLSDEECLRYNAELHSTIDDPKGKHYTYKINY